MNPDHDSLATEEFLHRLARHYRPGHWVGGVRKAFGAVTEVPETLAGDLESGSDGRRYHVAIIHLKLDRATSPGSPPLET